MQTLQLCGAVKTLLCLFELRRSEIPGESHPLAFSISMANAICGNNVVTYFILGLLTKIVMCRLSLTIHQIKTTGFMVSCELHVFDLLKSIGLC